MTCSFVTIVKKKQLRVHRYVHTNSSGCVRSTVRPCARPTFDGCRLQGHSPVTVQGWPNGAQRKFVSHVVEFGVHAH